jgi:predicted molibdopterin-dependent oxidoreductase YjgC
MEEIRLTIDGKSVAARRGQTILEVARENNIDIPTLCYHSHLSKSGACRICLVRINGRMLKPSCCEEATEGIEVVTEDESLIRIRKFILSLLLSEGDHNCLYCDADGSCELQSLIKKYDVDPAEIDLGVRRDRVVDYVSSPALKRNENRCILCGRCVRACKEVQVANVWGIAERGSQSHLIADDDKSIGESSCVKCGTCVQLCPTGALTFQTVLGRGAEWELKKESSICIYCGVGCKIDFYTNKQGLLVKALGNAEGPNNGHLCVKGRFGFDFVQNDKRLSKPLIKKDGAFVEAEWDEALHLVAEKLGAIKATHGPDSIAALSSAKCTNEENYLMQKFVRAVLGSNNIDHCARL